MLDNFSTSVKHFYLKMQNCYNAGRIPRENLHDQNAKSKAESLQFIKELADQNKLLKKRIEELEVNKIVQYTSNLKAR